jgi:hypothetical protein
MSEQAKQDFAFSVKRLRYFFNNLKEVKTSIRDMEAAASTQQVTRDEADQVTKWMEEATKAIIEAKKFTQLIDKQEM